MKRLWFVATLGDQQYGLPVEQVTEAVRAAKLVTVPQAPRALLGALLFRGRPVPVIDLRPRLGIESRPIAARDHFVVCEIGGRAGVLVAEELRGLVELDPTAGLLNDVPAPEYVIAAVTDPMGRPVLLLDLARVLEAPEVAAIQRAIDGLDLEEDPRVG